MNNAMRDGSVTVSTHSRLKAAGFADCQPILLYDCFNTQPPEGGWFHAVIIIKNRCVSTHSRLKAAGPRRAKRRRN